jgi:ribose-phosphate pyrophosphokinase
MRSSLIAGSANPALAEAVAAEVGTGLCEASIKRFPDGELHVELSQSVRGHDMFVLQPTAPPVETHLLELLLLADACRRAGAARLTAVMPYFGYARQDRRAGKREAVGARLVADLIAAAGFQRVVAIDLHSLSLEGFFTPLLEHLSASADLIDAVRPYAAGAVVVAPDVGASRLAEAYARALQLPAAIVHKTRLSGEEVKVRQVTGEVAGRAPLIVDDMISTGGTIEAAVAALRAAGCGSEITVVATHALLVGRAADRLHALRLRRLVVTDTVALPAMPDLPTRVVSVAPLLGDAIKRLRDDESLVGLARGY